VKTQTEQLTLRIPKELLAKLTKLAKQARQHRSTLVREILERAVNAGLKRSKVFALVAVLLICAGVQAQAQQSDPVGQALSVAPEAIGKAIGIVLWLGILYFGVRSAWRLFKLRRSR